VTDEQITALMAQLRTLVRRNGHNDMAVTTIDTDRARAILALVDAQAAEIARLRETVALLHNVIARAALAQETQP
jgi:hypothetical protein